MDGLVKILGKTILQKYLQQNVHMKVCLELNLNSNMY